VQIDQAYPGISNTIQCSDGKKVSYILDFAGNDGVKLQLSQTGKVTTLNQGTLEDKDINNALCGVKSQAPNQVIQSIKKWIFDKLHEGQDRRPNVPGSVRG